MKMKKVDKQISFTKPKSDLLYTPNEFVECLTEKVDTQDRRCFINKVIWFNSFL